MKLIVTKVACINRNLFCLRNIPYKGKKHVGPMGRILEKAYPSLFARKMFWFDKLY